MEKISQWLKANKISPNEGKKRLLYFTSGVIKKTYLNFQIQKLILTIQKIFINKIPLGLS